MIHDEPELAANGDDSEGCVICGRTEQLSVPASFPPSGSILKSLDDVYRRLPEKVAERMKNEDRNRITNEVIKSGLLAQLDPRTEATFEDWADDFSDYVSSKRIDFYAYY